MSLQDQFREFVFEQPADKRINNSEGWSKCAIGEFAKSTGRWKEYLSPFSYEVCYDSRLHSELNRSSFSTYGELQQYFIDRGL